MNKIYLHTNNLEKQLRFVKVEQQQIRERRRELMYRLNVAGFSPAKIADIYGCTRQYVEQEIAKHAEQNKAVTA